VLGKAPGAEMKRLGLIVAVTGMCFLAACGPSEVSVTTQRYDNARTGQNLSETLLNTSNVNQAEFGKLFSRMVDDEIYAQPLYIPSVSIPDVGVRNVLYIATVNNTVYAFDADDPNASEPLWKVNLTDRVPGATPVKARDVGENCGPQRDFTENIGIVSTPVIHAGRQTIYLVARTKEGNEFVQRLHALDIATGAPRPNSPVVIKASVPGSGSGSSDGELQFDPKIHNQRAALLLANGIVYIAWASHCDTGPYHGWIIGYDAVTLQQALAKVVTPNGAAGGIWQSNSGPSADRWGTLYLTIGNGTATAQKGGQDFGNAFLKLSPSGAVLDWFIPFNFKMLNEVDYDLGAAGVLLIPNTNLLASGGKEGKLYLVDRRRLGHFRTKADKQIVQSFMAGEGGIFGTPTYWNGPHGPHLYLWGASDRGKMFSLREGQLDPKPISQTKESAARPGGILSLSANGAVAGTGILWAVTASDNANWQVVAGTLRAFDAEDLTREIWNSKQNALRDDLGALAKFNTPVVANGKVYVATFSKQVAVYGLLPDSATLRR
jgi:hypothetical protein